MSRQQRSGPSIYRTGSSGFAAKHLVASAILHAESMASLLDDLTSTLHSSDTQIAFTVDPNMVPGDHVALPVTSLEKLGERATSILEALQRIQRAI